VEATTLADSQAFAAQFNQLIVEALTSGDYTAVSGWLKINDAQMPNWGYKQVTVSMTGAFADTVLGGIPFAGSISGSLTAPFPVDATPTAVWSSISNNPNTIWVKVNNFQ
jgi:hypothetical protein